MHIWWEIFSQAINGNRWTWESWECLKEYHQYTNIWHHEYNMNIIFGYMMGNNGNRIKENQYIYIYLYHWWEYMWKWWENQGMSSSRIYDGVILISGVQPCFHTKSDHQWINDEAKDEAIGFFYWFTPWQSNVWLGRTCWTIMYRWCHWISHSHGHWQRIFHFAMVWFWKSYETIGGGRSCDMAIWGASVKSRGTLPKNEDINYVLVEDDSGAGWRWTWGTF